MSRDAGDDGEDGGQMPMPPELTWVHGCWIAPTDALLILIEQGMADDAEAQEVGRALSRVRRDLDALILAREMLDDPPAGDA
jgi:hypothetical protein